VRPIYPVFKGILKTRLTNPLSLLEKVVENSKVFFPLIVALLNTVH
jgi:hypothetical protein